MKKIILAMLALASAGEKEFGDTIVNQNMTIYQKDQVDHVTFERLHILPDCSLIFSNPNNIVNPKVIMTVEKEAINHGFVRADDIDLTVVAKSHVLLRNPGCMPNIYTHTTPLYDMQRLCAFNDPIVNPYESDKFYTAKQAQVD